jgi:hypothetical protein
VNKNYFIFLFLIFSSIAGAQDSLPKIQQTKSYFTEKDIQVDHAPMKSKTFKKDFKKNYSSREFIYEEKPHKPGLWERFIIWLSELFGRRSTSSGQSNYIGGFMKIISIVIIVLVVFFIVKAIMNKEGQWLFGKNSDKKILENLEVEKNIHIINFEQLIREALQSNNKRLAIRYYYLWLLKKLSDKGIITWDIEKTNTDYLYEIQNQNRKEEFGYLSYIYNNIWYGEFEIDESAFEKSKFAFDKVIKSL